MTDRIAGEIFEKCYDSKKIGVDQLKQVRHSLSYSYILPGEGNRRGQLAGGKGSMEKFQPNEPAEDQKTSEANTNSNSGESP